MGDEDVGACEVVGMDVSGSVGRREGDDEVGEMEVGDVEVGEVVEVGAVVVSTPPAGARDGPDVVTTTTLGLRVGRGVGFACFLVGLRVVGSLSGVGRGDGGGVSANGRGVGTGACTGVAVRFKVGFLVGLRVGLGVGAGCSVVTTKVGFRVGFRVGEGWMVVVGDVGCRVGLRVGGTGRGVGFLVGSVGGVNCSRLFARSPRVGVAAAIAVPAGRPWSWVRATATVAASRASRSRSHWKPLIVPRHQVQSAVERAPAAAEPPRLLPVGRRVASGERLSTTGVPPPSSARPSGMPSASSVTAPGKVFFGGTRGGRPPLLFWRARCCCCCCCGCCGCFVRCASVGSVAAAGAVERESRFKRTALE